MQAVFDAPVVPYQFQELGRGARARVRLVTVSHIQGTFLGYAPRVNHWFGDGSEWEQTGNTKERIYRERPEWRTFSDRDRLRIDVQGISGVAVAKEQGNYPLRQPGTIMALPRRVWELRGRDLTMQEIAAARGVSRRTASRYMATTSGQ